jgi:hypothetical protein
MKKNIIGDRSHSKPIIMAYGPHESEVISNANKQSKTTNLAGKITFLPFCEVQHPSCLYDEKDAQKTVACE